MKLNDEEKRMLDGADGEAVRMSMEMLVAIGDIYGAERMQPVSSAHVAGLSLKSHGLAGMEWAEDLASTGARVKVPTTLNVIGVDRSRDLGFSPDWRDPQIRIGEAYEKMGCYGTSSCVPYYQGFLPRLKQHVAWAESSAIIFVNSVLGARTNREGGPSALAAGLTGRTPYYGFHLAENRHANVCYRVEADLKDLADYGALGAYVGKRLGTDTPVFGGMEAANPSLEQLVTLGAALASSGGAALFHMVGVTPEAATLEQALGSKKCEERIFGKKELAAGYEQLTSGKEKKVDLVAIGCPHSSLNQIADIARLLEGRHVAPGVTLWIHTNIAIKALAGQMGYVAAIERAGGLVTQDLCVVLSVPEALGFRVLATNSPKMAFYAPGGNGLPTWYGSVERCLDAAVTGEWS